MIYLASYKGKRKKHSLKAFYNSFQDALIRVLTRGKYSHSELAILRHDGQYDCYSASLRDGGVRHKVMSLPADRWDLQAIKGAKKSDIVCYYNSTKNQQYDLSGALGVVSLTSQSQSKSFCSEWCYNAIFKSNQGWRFSPNDLATLIKDTQKPLKISIAL